MATKKKKKKTVIVTALQAKLISEDKKALKESFVGVGPPKSKPLTQSDAKKKHGMLTEMLQELNALEPAQRLHLMGSERVKRIEKSVKPANRTVVLGQRSETS